MEAPPESTGGPEFEPLPLLIPCILCSRKFLPESLVRHKKACEKVLMKKRKQFDSAKQRLTGELAECLPLPPAKLKRPSPARKSSRWKEKHLELLETLRAARVGLSAGSCAAPLLAKPSDHEQCPHCGRSFGPKAFDRHEEYCREKFARLEHQRPSVSQQAKERLEARTKYRAPCVRSRRSITREKYLPASKREPSPGSVVGTTGNSSPAFTRAESKPALVKQKSLSNTKENDSKAAATTGSHFVRASVNTSSMRSSLRRASQGRVNPQPLAAKTINPQPLAPKTVNPQPTASKIVNPQPLAPKALNNRSNTEPPIRQTLQALPSNMRIKKDAIASRGISTGVRRNQDWDPLERSVNANDIGEPKSEAGPDDDDTSDLIDFSTPRQESEPVCDTRYIGANVGPSTPNHSYGSVSENHRKLILKALGNSTKCLVSDASSSDSGFGSCDLLSGEIQNPFVSNVLDYDFGNHEESFTESNSLNSSCLARNENHAFRKEQECLDRSPFPNEPHYVQHEQMNQPFSNTSNAVSKLSPKQGSLLEDEVAHSHTYNDEETFQMSKFTERLKSRGISSESLREILGQKDSNFLNHDEKTHLKNFKVKYDKTPDTKSNFNRDEDGNPIKDYKEIINQEKSPRQHFDKLQRQTTNRTLEKSVKGRVAIQSDISSSNLDSIVYKQSLDQYNDKFDGFIENGLNVSATIQVKSCSNKSTHEETGKSNANQESPRSIASEKRLKKRSVQEKAEFEHDRHGSASDGAVEKLDIQQSKKTIRPKKKTPKKSSQAQCETESKQIVVKQNVDSSCIPGNTGISNRKNIRNLENDRLDNFSKDVPERHSITTLTPQDAPYDSLDEEPSSAELEASNLYDSLNDLNSVEGETNSATHRDTAHRNMDVFELFSNEHYVNEDENSSIADSELIAIADRMNKLSSKTNNTIDLAHNSEEELRCFDPGRTLKAHSSLKNEEPNLLPLRNAKKSHNLLIRSKKEDDGIDVVVESIREIKNKTLSSKDSNLNSKLAIKLSSEECAKQKNSSKLLPLLSKSKLSAPSVASGKNRPITANKPVKFPPLKKEPLKHKSDAKRGNISNCVTLPPLNSVTKRGVSRIPKPKNISTTKLNAVDTSKTLPAILTRRSIPDKSLHKNTQVKNTSKKYPPATPDISSKRSNTVEDGLEFKPMADGKGFTDMKDRKIFENLRPREKSPDTSKLETDLPTNELEFATVITHDEMENTNEKLCSMPLCEDKMTPSSPYANSTMHEDVHFGEGKAQNGGSKTSGDSAYNSLSRKTDHASSNSSSGSESSFPNPSGAVKPSRFCHECGTQYPLASAKFCCQCGVRRLCLA